MAWESAGNIRGPEGPAGPAGTAETADPWGYLLLGSNLAVSTTAFADVTTMSFVGQANTLYEVEFIGAIQTAATTTGAALALDIPSGTIIGQGIHNLAAATLTGWEQIADNATTGAGSGMRATGANVPITAKWLVAIGSTAGTVQLRMRSEIASSAVTLQGGLCVLKFRKASRQATSGPIVPITEAQWTGIDPGVPGTLYVIVPTVVGNPSHKWVELTQEEYDELVTEDLETLYVVND